MRSEDRIAELEALVAQQRDLLPLLLLRVQESGRWGARGRGRALSFGLLALPYYQRTNPALASIARHAIAEAFGDHEHTNEHAP